MTMLTIREFCEKTGIPRARVKYWLDHLRKEGRARKTGPHKRAIWLIDFHAEAFLSAEHKPGPKAIQPDQYTVEEWARVYFATGHSESTRSVNATARHFGVTWQTAARRLDCYGIRAYRSRGKP